MVVEPSNMTPSPSVPELHQQTTGHWSVACPSTSLRVDLWVVIYIQYIYYIKKCLEQFNFNLTFSYVVLQICNIMNASAEDMFQFQVTA